MARILVVDDEEPVRELIKDVLAMQGHSCDAAADGSEALERVRKSDYGLVIMDRNMPRMDGIKTLLSLRANPKHKDLPVIMCTSAGITNEVAEAFNAGASDYLFKPINIQALVDKVQKALKPD